MRVTESQVAIREPETGLMPIMALSAARERHKQVLAFVQDLMEDGRDYGVIPGTGGKPTLYKPGAEKLTTFFGLTPTFTLRGKVEDWSGADHGSEPFFYYWYTCHLHRGDFLIAEADGSCNSRETQYRYRKGQRLCPSCGEAAIIKGRAEYGGGWLCWGKRGGCGAKFKDGATEIESQEVGRVLNEDIADQVNSILKKAQKRAFVAVTLIGVNASQFFTQDLEDMTEDFETEAATIEHKTNPRDSAPRPKTPKSAQAKVAPKEEGDWDYDAWWALAKRLGVDNDTVHAGFGVASMKDYTGTKAHAKTVLDIAAFGVFKTLSVTDMRVALGCLPVDWQGTFDEAQERIQVWIANELT